MLGAFWSSPFSSWALGTAVFEVVGVAGVDLLLCVGVWACWGGEARLVPGTRYHGHMHPSVHSKRKPLRLLILMEEARNPIALESRFLWIIPT